MNAILIFFHLNTNIWIPEGLLEHPVPSFTDSLEYNIDFFGSRSQFSLLEQHRRIIHLSIISTFVSRPQFSITLRGLLESLNRSFIHLRIISTWALGPFFRSLGPNSNFEHNCCFYVIIFEEVWKYYFLAMFPIKCNFSHLHLKMPS